MSGRDTRHRILAAAQRLIERQGYTLLTTKDIAREAGYSEGTIFNHFTRKEDLCLAVVLENAPPFRQVIAAIQPGQNSVSGNLESMALEAMSFFEKLIPLAVSLFGDVNLLMRHRKAMVERGRGPQDVFQIVASYVSGEQRMGRIRPELSAISVAALLLGACFHRAFIRQVMGKDAIPISDREIAHTLVATLSTGLTPPAA